MRSLNKGSCSSIVLTLVCAVWPFFGSNCVAMRTQSVIHSPNGSSLDCTHASFDHYNENRRMWVTIRNRCEDLLCIDDLARYQELCDRDVFDEAGAENCQAKWENLVKKWDPDSEDIDVNDYERQAYLCDKIEDESKDMHNKVMAHDQLKAYSLYLKDKPAKLAAYHKFLVNICFLCVHVILL